MVGVVRFNEQKMCYEFVTDPKANPLVLCSHNRGRRFRVSVDVASKYTECVAGYAAKTWVVDYNYLDELLKDCTKEAVKEYITLSENCDIYAKIGVLKRDVAIKITLAEIKVDNSNKLLEPDGTNENCLFPVPDEASAISTTLDWSFYDAYPRGCSEKIDTPTSFTRAMIQFIDFKSCADYLITQI